MTTPFFADEKLARRIENNDAYFGLQSAVIVARMFPDIGAAAEPFAGGYAVYTGVRSPLTQALGLGMNGPVTEAEIVRLEEFYLRRGSNAHIEFCPHAHSTLLRLLGKRAYRVEGCSNLLVRPVKLDSPELPRESGVSVQRCLSNEAELWAKTVAEGFSKAVVASSENLRVLMSLEQRRNTTAVLAWVDGSPAGGGALATHDNIGVMYGASTLPRFRRKGVQSEIIRSLVRFAAQAGCEFIYSLTAPGSISQHNLERQDFRVGYTRFEMEKEL
jgi:GNAT superfamily N-acetyltransferase